MSSKVFPGITETGRWRMDESLNVKYDLPKNLHGRLGLPSNSDHRPVEGATGTDHPYRIALGREL
ncbi:MAG: hypothetical protein KDC01_08315 [Flavobacteriales bacterium]|nr:hypothetical protein [Flavobacteriales bacterium]